MKREEEIRDVEKKIIEYLSGRADREDIRFLEGWVRHSEENQKLFLDYKQIWNLSIIGKESLIDANEEWRIFEDSIKENKVILAHKGNKKRIWSILSMAAVIILLIGALFWIFNFNDFTGKEVYRAEELVNVSEMSDGSIVSLNLHTKIKFDNGSQRKAILKGDAFFEVKPDKARPFIVHAEDLNVRVLGTSFYIEAQKDKPSIDVTVESGEVLVWHLKDSLILVKDQKAVFDRNTRRLIRTINTDRNYLSWKTRSFIFDDHSLEMVIAKLNKIYGTRIFLGNPELGKCRITARFNEMELDAIMHILSETLDLKVIRRDDKYFLEGNTCE